MARNPDRMHVRTTQLGDQRLRVAVKPGAPAAPPLAVFNGLGASLEFLERFARTIDGEVVLFDVPGIGGSPLPPCPYRFAGLARLVLAGTRDPLIHVANARLLEWLIPDSELRLIDDGHPFVLTSRATVAPLVERFLRTPERARATTTRMRPITAAP